MRGEPMRTGERLALPVGIVTTTLLLLSTLGSMAAAGSVTTNPVQPLLDIPFFATGTALSVGSKLFISSDATCTKSLTTTCSVKSVVSGSSFGNGTCIFTVGSAALEVKLTTPRTSVPAAYWCVGSPGSAKQVATLQMHKMEVTPEYVFNSEESVLTFGSAVPVGTTVGFYADELCRLLTTGGGPFMIAKERTVKLTTKLSSFSLYICASTFTVNGSTTQVTLVNTVLLANPYTVNPATGVRHQTIAVSSSTQPYAQFYLSTRTHCADPRPVYQSSIASQMIMKVDVPRGEYLFCGSLLASENGVYIPATNTFTVLEYDVVPRTLYIGKVTDMSFALDAVPVQSALEAVLSTSEDCTAASSWQNTWGNPMQWSAKLLGVHYACVRRKDNTAAVGYASVIIATDPPTTTFAPATPVRGVSLRVTLTHVNATKAFFIVGLFASPDCKTLLVRGTASPATSASASLAVPLTAPDSLHYCVSNPLSSDPAMQEEVVRYHKLETLAPQPFALQHAPLRVGAPSTITLDSTVHLAKGTTVSLVHADASKPPCEATDMPTLDVAGAAFVLGPITFPEAGTWDVCVREPGADYLAVQRVTVYGNATVTPRGVVAGVEGAIVVRGLPPGAAVFVTSAPQCASDAIVLGRATSSAEGAATLTLRCDSVGTLLLCCDYPSTALQPVLQAAGSVRSASPRVAPAVVSLTAQTNGPQLLSFVAAGAAVLDGHAAYLLPGKSACPSGTATPGAAIVLPALKVATGSDTPRASLELRAAMVGTRYLACVNINGSFVATGTVTVVLPAPRLASDPAPLVAGLPATIRLLGTYASAAQVDTYAVVRGDVDCTTDLDTKAVLARGSIDPHTGVTTPCLVPQDASLLTRLRVCVAPRHSLLDGAGAIGYAAAGELDIIAFAPLSPYAQLRRPASDVTGWPVHTAAAQYLVRCSTATDDCLATPAGASAACAAAATRYSVGGTTQGDLFAPRGSYLLCQSATLDGVMGTVAANATVGVVDAFAMTTNADLTRIRSYVPFGANINGGPMGTTFYSVVVQPASVPCSIVVNESQTFTSSESSIIINISDIEPHTDVHFCAGPTTTSSRIEAMRATLHHYMSPAYIFADTLTTIALPAQSAGTSALLSSSRSLPLPVQGGSRRPLSGNRVSFTVDGCGENENITELFYHEFNGAWSAPRGRMLLIRTSSCRGGAGAVNIRTVDAAPGTPISDAGIDTRFLAVAGIGTSNSSASLPGIGVLSTGYAPAMGEDAAFHVWAHPIGDPHALFTTATATLRVRNWAVTPAYALSRYNATVGAAPHTLLHINDATPPGCTFFSQSPRCDNSLGDAAEMGTSTQAAVYSATGVSGPVYVCTCHPQTGAPLAVASFTSLLLPQVLQASPAIVRGANYIATLQAKGYTLQTTNTFLSHDHCVGSLPLQPTGASTAAVVSVSFGTASIAQKVEKVSLCVRTPAGTGAAIANVPVASGSMWPTQFAVGATGATIFMPLSPRTTFQLSATATGCTDVSGMPTFSTDAEGYGTLSLLRANGDALPLGYYAVCAAPPTRAAAALEVIEVVPASHFDVRGIIFVLGVPSRMELQQDLHTADLIAGFSTTAACSPITTDHGTWAALSSTAIEVRATAVSSTGVFLCAQVPANGTVVALPHSSASPGPITFVQLAMALPTGSWDTCTDYLVNQCYPPGSAGSTAADVLTVVHGDCCDRTAQAQAVGSASMASGICRLRLDAAKVAAYATDTSFGVCAWNPNKSSACATLRRVTVTTNCTPSKVGRGARMSSGAVAGIVMACTASSVALLVCAVWLACRLCGAKKRNNDTQSDEESPSFGDTADTAGAREQRQRLGPLWNPLDNAAKDVILSGRGGGEGVASAKWFTPTIPLSSSRVTAGSVEVPQDGTPNCMDGLPDVITKYYSFLDDSDFDYETVSQIPGEGEPSTMDEELEAMLAVPRASALPEELEAKRRAELRVVADRNATLLAVREERHRMKEEDPVKLKGILLQEREEWTRAALESRYRRADYNLTVLFKSSLEYNNALWRRRWGELSESPSDESELLSVGSWDVAPLAPLDNERDRCMDARLSPSKSHASVYSPTASFQYRISKSPVLQQPQLLTTGLPPARSWSAGSQSSAAETQPSPCSPNDLYHRRRFLEFPFVTNSLQTLIGGDKNLPEPVFLRGLTLIDLQAFHPKHRWLVDPPQPSHSANLLPERKGMWAFMAPGSTVPFVRRYLTLLEEEFRGRRRALQANATFWKRVFWEKRNVPVFSTVEEVQPVYNFDDARSFCTTSLEYRNLSSSENSSDGEGAGNKGTRRRQTTEELWAKEKVASASIVERRRVEQELASLTITKNMNKREKKKIEAAQAAFRAAQSAERRARAAKEKAEAALLKAEAANKDAKTAKAGCERRSLSRTRPTSPTPVGELAGQEFQRMEELRRLGMR
ncbi:hypothetical protein NXY56_006436 [Leishmania guyanensis]